jgi:hypothetical protein
MVLASVRNLCNQWFPPKPAFTEAEVSSQQGKVFIVTGGNGAVGYELIKILYATGATIYMASRSEVTTPPSPIPPRFHSTNLHSGKSRKSHPIHHHLIASPQNPRQSKIPTPRPQRPPLHPLSGFHLRRPRNASRRPMEQRRCLAIKYRDWRPNCTRS